MRALLTFSFVCIIVSVGSAQTNKFLSTLDAEVTPNQYLEASEEQWQVFLSDSRLDEEIDVQNFDEELLAAAVFHTINKYRKRHGRTVLSFAPQLDVAAQNYLDFYSANSFNRTEKNSSKLNKAAQFAARQLGFKPKLVDVIVNKQKMIAHNGRSFFYNRHDEETDLHLFYGRRESLKDSTFVPQPIKLHTYRSLAANLVAQNSKYPNGQCVRSRAYSFMACRIEFDKRSLHKNVIPTGKVIMIFGGYRTQDYKVRKREAQATANQ
jgi:hypothetical protein